MEITFRVADNSDTETLLRFIGEYYEFDHHFFDDETLRTALAKILNDESLGRVWLIQEGKNTIGYIVLTFGYSLEFRGREAVLDEIYIQNSHRGQGVGKKAIQFLEEICPSLEIKALHLEVERKNTVAQSFYRKVGFADQDSYLMTKWIAT
jgi:ribosomal protein S18 acetylase RimI-like enzyme